MTRSELDAARLDRAIDSVITGSAAPVGDEDELVVTARLLHRSLPRLHPGFGFEELLAARLAAARRMELAPAGGTLRTPPTPIRPDLDSVLPEEASSAMANVRRRRNLVAGGAIASGVSLALPIAGAAIVVWRRTRSSGGMF